MILRLPMIAASLALALSICAAELPNGVSANGKRLAGICRSCHGLDGFAKIPIAPHIGGEAPTYISRQLEAFRNGTRSHEMMSLIAVQLSDQDIADLALWYSGFLPKAQKMEPIDAVKSCLSCHGENGLAMTSDTPNLAGESNIYIETQLKAFRTGKRVHEIMTPIAQNIDEGELRAIANWFAAIDFALEPAKE